MGSNDTYPSFPTSLPFPVHGFIFYHPTLPIIFSISSIDIAPFLSILGISEVKSIIVEASPNLHFPESIKISTFDFIASDNSS